MDRGDLFVRTLAQSSQGSGSHWLSGPLGVAAHAVALGALTLFALYAPSDNLAPRLAPVALSFAPPPPPPLRRGNDLETEVHVAAVPAVVRTSLTDPRPFSTIPDEILSPDFDVALGVPDGFDDGQLEGMRGGMAGGVVGGVPGGVVSGVVGGTGAGLPSFETPDVGPRPIRMPQPGYTREAIRENVSGAVVLRAVIDAQGKVQVLKVLRSVPELDSEAIRVVESLWRFEPATKNGRPIPALSNLVVRFQLY